MSAAQPAPGAVMGIEQIVRFADLWRSIVPPEAAGLNPDVFIPLLRRVHGDCDLTVEGEQRVQQPGSLRELGIATEIDVQNSVDAMRRTMPTFEHRRDVQVKRCAVVLVPDDVRCSRCSEKEIEHTLELRPLGGRAFDVRFLDGSQLGCQASSSRRCAPRAAPCTGTRRSGGATPATSRWMRRSLAPLCQLGRCASTSPTRPAANSGASRPTAPSRTRRSCSTSRRLLMSERRSPSRASRA